MILIILKEIFFFQSIDFKSNRLSLMNKVLPISKSHLSEIGLPHVLVNKINNVPVPIKINYSFYNC